ncbi:MFS transporter [Aspergillus bertholletiae]|uniref:MFS transporter n=1 Tax=Aspergillus bertholletiae TaxID=1226010 RepID=A0A5N7BN76_9EURO|nr:MFS transporter [Aspergillus bertholletiae]
MPNLPSSNAPESGSTGSSIYSAGVSYAKVVEGELDLSQSEIEWLDLGLDTPLPVPTALISQNASQSRLPCPPNVQKYASPLQWSAWRKWIVTWISCVVTTVACYSAGEMSPASEELTSEWGITLTAYNSGVTLFCIGFGLAPMILATFSEINGRKPVFIGSGVLFCASTVACGGTHVFAGLLVARLLQGVGASTFSTMVGGVISDIYSTEERNVPMALFSSAALLGTGLAPLISSVVVYHSTWRWVYYSQGIVSGFCVVVMILFFQETRSTVLLQQKADALNKYYEKLEHLGYYGVILGDKGEVRRIRWTQRDGEKHDSLREMIKVSCYRPFYMLVTEPVVFFFSLWLSFSWAVLYLQFSAVPLVFRTNHNFNTEQIGAVFTSMCCGIILITVVSIYQERMANHFGLLPKTPEARLYFACLQAPLVPVGLFWFGWTSFPSVHWILPTIAIGCLAMGIFSVYLAVFNYLADAYGPHASSAIAAQSFCRNILGGIFPLITDAMFTNLGYPAASSLLGGIAAVLTLVPWVLVLYGPTIRARSKMTVATSN